jgi:hypothetical protein
MSNVTPYNPLDKRNLGASVAEALLEQKPHPLASVAPFRGAGIYAVYYVGPFKPYATIANRNREGRFELPIYIGKAVPAGARKGGFGLDAEPGPALFNRLAEHAESIELATNLEIDDFYCRYLVVDDIWIPLGESLLIAKFSPIWNKLIDGFGNHDPGRGRYQGLRPLWDVVHPGRGWAAKCQARTETAEQIADRVKEYVKALRIPAKPRLLAKD